VGQFGRSTNGGRHRLTRVASVGRYFLAKPSTVVMAPPGYLDAATLDLMDDPSTPGTPPSRRRLLRPGNPCLN
jgi:hypothetical protein